jgi:hypothetical protein
VLARVRQEGDRQATRRESRDIRSGQAFQTSEELVAALARLDENGLPMPIPPRFGKRVIAGAAVAVVALALLRQHLAPD